MTPVELGTDMWKMLQATFDDVAAVNGLTTVPSKAQLWSGFIASATGAMTADIGSDNAYALLYTLAKETGQMNVPDPSSPRPSLKVVKP